MRKVTLASFVFCALAAAITGTLVAATAQTPGAPLCRGLKGEGYSPGATIRHENQVYRCFNIFGDGLTSTGVAWIEMAPSFAPREPTAR